MDAIALEVVPKLWGTTRCLHCGPVIEIWHASIKRGGYSSKHSHQLKLNAFYVVSGKLVVRMFGEDGKVVNVYIEAGQHFSVLPTFLHQFEALQDTELIETYHARMPEDIFRVTEGGTNAT